MTVLVVATAALLAVLVVGVIGDGSMNFYAAAVHAAARDRDRAAGRATRVRARAARRHRPTYRATGDQRFA